MMRTAHTFTDLMESDPLEGGAALAVGDARSLKRSYHKLAAKLHPDRQTGSSTAVQVPRRLVASVPAPPSESRARAAPP